MGGPDVADAAYFQPHGTAADPIAYMLAGYAGLMALAKLGMLHLHLTVQETVKRRCRVTKVRP